MGNVKERKLVFATATCRVGVKGGSFHVRQGEAWDASDPVVKAHPSLFDDVPVNVRTSVKRVEQATKAPGELRG